MSSGTSEADRKLTGKSRETISKSSEVLDPPSLPVDGDANKLGGKEKQGTNDQPQVPSKQPTLEESWRVLTKEVTSLDDALIGGWKEDIDTLLVFAGLFSAVVTAFTIESYKWLSEEAEDQTVMLLTQITDQIANRTSSPPEKFEVSTSNLTINVLWFLSLIIALVDAVFALLCKQWIREHRRVTHTRTPGEALALRWLRHESLDWWGVPTIVACLPMLLEFALFLFLGGVLELLRTRHPIPFWIAVAVVGFAGLFYLGTTIIPGVSIIRQALQVAPKLWEMRTGTQNHSHHDRVSSLPPTLQLTCPYKSPQAWIVFSVLKAVSQLPGIAHMLHFFRGRDSQWLNSAWAFRETMGTLTGWPEADLEVIHRFDIDLAPPFYELKAFRWLVGKLRDSQIMRLHLQNILVQTPLHLVMPTVFDQWFVHPEDTWAEEHVVTALNSPPTLPLTVTHRISPDRLLNPVRKSELFYRLLHWNNILVSTVREEDDAAVHVELENLLRNLWKCLLQDGTPVDDNFPFSSIDVILKSNTTSHLVPDLWELLMDIGHIPRTSNEYWERLMRHLARFIISSSPDYALHQRRVTTSSHFVESKPALIRQAHDAMIRKGVFYPLSAGQNMEWIHAMDIIQKAQQPPKRPDPEVKFKAIPGFFLLPLSRLEEALGHLSSSENLDDDTEYLDSFVDQWADADGPQRIFLVKILSKHINNYPQPPANLSRTDIQRMFPIVISSTGFKLIEFVRGQLAKAEKKQNRKTTKILPTEVEHGWNDAVARVDEIRRRYYLVSQDQNGGAVEVGSTLGGQPCRPPEDIPIVAHPAGNPASSRSGHGPGETQWGRFGSNADEIV
ncbi:hypothetical protein PQX77_000335 [Marasmius sp. AFHP31]|nr:hypothetical protein PQX77_000335 [Marasmius sp. AFHP31]